MLVLRPNCTVLVWHFQAGGGAYIIALAQHPSWLFFILWGLSPSSYDTTIILVGVTSASRVSFHESGTTVHPPTSIQNYSQSQAFSSLVFAFLIYIPLMEFPHSRRSNLESFATLMRPIQQSKNLPSDQPKSQPGLRVADGFDVLVNHHVRPTLVHVSSYNNSLTR